MDADQSNRRDTCFLSNTVLYKLFLVHQHMKQRWSPQKQSSDLFAHNKRTNTATWAVQLYMTSSGKGQGLSVLCFNTGIKTAQWRWKHKNISTRWLFIKKHVVIPPRTVMSSPPVLQHLFFSYEHHSAEGDPRCELICLMMYDQGTWWFHSLLPPML